MAAVAGNAQVTISWTSVTGATSYNIYWSATSGVNKSTGTKISNVTSPYAHTGLPNGSSYYYVVTSINAAGESTESAQVAATTNTSPSGPTLPNAPSNIASVTGNAQATVSWSSVTGATSYNIYWSATSGVNKSTGTKISNVTSPYAHTGLTNGSVYYYVVTSINAAGESAESVQVSATPGAPIGLSRSNPYNRVQTVSASHWDVKVTETIRGSAAWQAISAANQFNDPPPTGMEYLLVKIHAKSTYTDNNTHNISKYDFRVTGDILRENLFASVVSPSPALDTNLFAGGETEGWTPYLVGTGEGKLILIVDELYNYTDGHLRFIALDDGAAISVDPGLGYIVPTAIGRERSSPALLTQTVTTEDWELSVQKVVRGDAAWLMVKNANQFNDPPAAGKEYVATKLRARYISTIDKSERTSNLYIRSTGNANVLYGHPIVVDPDPEFDATLFPGGSYEGWVVTQMATGETSIILVIQSLYDLSGVNTRYLSLE